MWRRSVEDMAAGTAPYLAPDIERYRTSYETLIDGGQNATSAEEMQRLLRENANSALLHAGQQLNSAAASNCHVGQHLPSFDGGA